MRWLVLLALGIVSCLADEKPCTTHHDGRYYDLTPLMASQDYAFKTPGNKELTINVCKRPVKESFGLKDVNDAEVAGFIRLDHGDFAIGKVNTTLTVQDSNPRLTLSGGSFCTPKSEQWDFRASTVIEFICDTSIFGPGDPRLAAQLPPGDDEDACAFFIQWRTHVACPTNEPGGAWGFIAFFIFTLISFALIYLVAGTLYNRFVLQLRGVEQIPKFSLESMKYHAAEAIDWIKDLVSGARGGGGGGGYSRMPPNGLNTSVSLPRSTPNTGTNPVSHHTQVSSPPIDETSGSGFTRPYPSRIPPGIVRKTDINPVSHQAQSSIQVTSSPQFGANQSSPLPAKKEKTRPKPIDLEGTLDEREFMLGEDEDDDVGSTTSAPIPPKIKSSDAGTNNPDAVESRRHDDPAALRERDKGPEGVIQL